MSVNILSSPTSPITVDDLIQWKMEITDLGTPTRKQKNDRISIDGWNRGH
jgi:hypothetical protein